MKPALYKNGVTTMIIGYSDGEAFEQATISASLSLTQGDEITIVNDRANDDIYGGNNYFTIFEGSLLTRT